MIGVEIDVLYWGGKKYCGRGVEERLFLIVFIFFVNWEVSRVIF